MLQCEQSVHGFFNKLFDPSSKLHRLDAGVESTRGFDSVVISSLQCELNHLVFEFFGVIEPSSVRFFRVFRFYFFRFPHCRQFLE
jgi:hypothetical protein